MSFLRLLFSVFTTVIKLRISTWSINGNDDDDDDDDDILLRLQQQMSDTIYVVGIISFSQKFTIAQEFRRSTCVRVCARVCKKTQKVVNGTGLKFWVGQLMALSENN